MKIQLMTDNLDVNDRAIFLAMPPKRDFPESVNRLRGGFQQPRNIFLRPYVRGGHRQKLLPGKAIVSNRRFIHCQKFKSCTVENPHRERIVLKQEAILHFCLTQRLFSNPSQSHVLFDGDIMGNPAITDVHGGDRHLLVVKASIFLAVNHLPMPDIPGGDRRPHICIQRTVLLARLQQPGIFARTSSEPYPVSCENAGLVHRIVPWSSVITMELAVACNTADCNSRRSSAAFWAVTSSRIFVMPLTWFLSL